MWFLFLSRVVTVCLSVVVCITTSNCDALLYIITLRNFAVKYTIAKCLSCSIVHVLKTLRNMMELRKLTRILFF